MLRHSLGQSCCPYGVNVGNADLTPECLWKREIGAEDGTRLDGARALTHGSIWFEL